MQLPRTQASRVVGVSRVHRQPTGELGPSHKWARAQGGCEGLAQEGWVRGGGPLGWAVFSLQMAVTRRH